MVCCRGFWNRHAARCTVAQIAQRTNSVYTIDERGDVKHWPQPVERVAVDWGPKGRRRRRAGGETEAGPEARMEDADPGGVEQKRASGKASSVTRRRGTTPSRGTTSSPATTPANAQRGRPQPGVEEKAEAPTYVGGTARAYRRTPEIETTAPEDGVRRETRSDGRAGTRKPARDAYRGDPDPEVPIRRCEAERNDRAARRRARGPRPAGRSRTTPGRAASRTRPQPTVSSVTGPTRKARQEPNSAPKTTSNRRPTVAGSGVNLQEEAYSAGNDRRRTAAARPRASSSTGPKCNPQTQKCGSGPGREPPKETDPHGREIDERTDRAAADTADKGTRRDPEEARQQRPADVRDGIHQLRNPRMRGRPHRRRQRGAARIARTQARGERRDRRKRSRVRRGGNPRYRDDRARNTGLPAPLPERMARSVAAEQHQRRARLAAPERLVRPDAERRNRGARRNPRGTDPRSTSLAH